MRSGVTVDELDFLLYIGFRPTLQCSEDPSGIGNLGIILKREKLWLCLDPRNQVLIAFYIANGYEEDCELSRSFKIHEVLTL